MKSGNTFRCRPPAGCPTCRARLPPESQLVVSITLKNLVQVRTMVCSRFTTVYRIYSYAFSPDTPKSNFVTTSLSPLRCTEGAIVCWSANKAEQSDPSNHTQRLTFAKSLVCVRRTAPAGNVSSRNCRASCTAASTSSGVRGAKSGVAAHLL